MRYRFTAVRSGLLAVWLFVLCLPLAAQQAATLPPPEKIAEGVQLYRLDDPALLSPAGPIAVQALRLDPGKVALESAAARAEQPRETVEALASRRDGVIAAINAGFFSMETGRPTAFLKIRGVVVSGTARARGAVGILERKGRTALLFDRLRVRIRPGGRPQYEPLLGSSARDWANTTSGVGGAGLLLLDGRELPDWTDERIAAGFETTRHPRTVIGVDAEGFIWLVTVDGRNPERSLGMSFAELQRLSRRLGLRSALNLDGGGSTTMWIQGRIVNHPSDAEGPRKVSDALLVVPRVP